MKCTQCGAENLTQTVTAQPFTPETTQTYTANQAQPYVNNNQEFFQNQQAVQPANIMGGQAQGTAGIGIWGFVEGIMLLAGSINVDGQGNPLKE